MCVKFASLLFFRKMVFPGSSSSSMEPEMIEIDDGPVVSGNRTRKSVSKSKGRGEQKKVLYFIV